MNTVEISFPAPPVDAVMPATGQIVLLWLFGIIVIITFFFAIRMAVKFKSALPVLFMFGGFCTVLLEPVVCNLGHIWWPAIGQITLFETNSRSIPVFVGFVYSFYFPIIYLVMFERIITNNFTSGIIWKTYFIALVCAYLLEMVPIQLGMWIYYDNQALWIGRFGLPLFWMFVNITCVFVALTLIKFFYPVMKGWKQLLVIPLSPLGAFMGHFGAGFPFYSATNSSASQFVVDLSGLASVGLCGVLMMGCTRILLSKKID